MPMLTAEQDELDGVVVRVSSQGIDHVRVMTALTRYVVRGLPDGFVAQPAAPIVVRPDSVPEPDLLVIHEHTLSRGHAENGLLAIEISDSSLRRDLGRKSPRSSADLA